MSNNKKIRHFQHIAQAPKHLQSVSEELQQLLLLQQPFLPPFFAFVSYEDQRRLIIFRQNLVTNFGNSLFFQTSVKDKNSMSLLVFADGQTQQNVQAQQNFNHCCDQNTKISCLIFLLISLVQTQRHFSKAIVKIFLFFCHEI